MTPRTPSGVNHKEPSSLRLLVVPDLFEAFTLGSCHIAVTITVP